jgi:hypothetical protein
METKMKITETQETLSITKAIYGISLEENASSLTRGLGSAYSEGQSTYWGD